VQRDGTALNFASAPLREDREVVLAAVHEHERALSFASADLRDDREVVLAAVRQHGQPALQYASPNLRYDREMELESAQRVPTLRCPFG
jgi:hypothetical protein